jgi:hypothetical protein
VHRQYPHLPFFAVAGHLLLSLLQRPTQVSFSFSARAVSQTLLKLFELILQGFLARDKTATEYTAKAANYA